MSLKLRITAALLLLVTLGLIFLVSSREFLRLAFPVAYVPEVEERAQRYKLDPYFVLAVVRVESNFKPDAQSTPGARGLMQILPETGSWIAQMRGDKEFTPDDLYDPEVNIEYGTWYLDYLLKMFDQDEHLTLAAYNAGLGRVKRWLAEEQWDGRPENVNAIPVLETRLFVRKVLLVKNMYQRIYPEMFPRMERSQLDG